MGGVVGVISALAGGYLCGVGAGERGSLYSRRENLGAKNRGQKWCGLFCPLGIGFVDDESCVILALRFC